MFKLIGAGIFSVLLFMSVTYMNAQDIKKEQSNTPKSTVKGPNFIDKNNDGICDNRSNMNQNAGNKGKMYVDKNNDGVCDNKDNNSCKHRNGKKGKGHHGKRCR